MYAESGKIKQAVGAGLSHTWGCSCFWEEERFNIRQESLFTIREWWKKLGFHSPVKKMTDCDIQFAIYLI
jgi:hypothetical protein